MTVLVFADHNNVELNSGTLNTITALHSLVMLMLS